MKDDFNEFSPDPTSRGSVTDWLMKVISTKKPGDGSPDELQNGHTELAHGGAAVAVEEMPANFERESHRSLAQAKPAVHDPGFTAEDLCGPPVLTPIIMPRKDEISAADLCFVPRGSELKPFDVTADITRNGSTPETPREYAQPEKPREDAVTAAEIMQVSTKFDEPREYVQPEKSREDSVTAADIMRDSALYGSGVPGAAKFQLRKDPVEHDVADASRNGSFHETDLKASFSAPEAVAEVAPPPAASVHEPITAAVVVPEPVVIEPEVAKSTAAMEALPIETAPESAPTGKRKRAGAGASKESVFAHEGIWGDAPKEQHVPEERVEEKASDQPISEDNALSLQQTKMRDMTPDELREMEKVQPEGFEAAWKTLGSVLPWIARSAPGSETGGDLNTQEARHEIAGLRLLQYEIRSTVHDHSLQLKRMEEHLTRVRELAETDTSRNSDPSENVGSALKLVRTLGMGLGALMIVLILMVGLILMHGR